MVEVLEDPGVGIVDDEAVIVSGGEIEAVAGAGPLAVLGEWPETSRGSINDDVYADMLARSDGDGVVVFIVANIHNKRDRCGRKTERDGWQLRESRPAKRKPYKRYHQGGHSVTSLSPLCSGEASPCTLR